MYQNKTTERRQIQLVLSYQKYWSNSIFHFIFLQKVSFIVLIKYQRQKFLRYEIVTRKKWPFVKRWFLLIIVRHFG